jgi:hypothetical protein
VSINPITRTRTRYFRHAYQFTRANIFHAAAVLFFYILLTKYRNKNCKFSQRFVIIRNFKAHIRSSCFLHVGITDCSKLNKCEFGIATTIIMSKPNFIKICPAFLDVKYKERQTQSALYAMWASMSCYRDNFTFTFYNICSK